MFTYDHGSNQLRPVVTSKKWAVFFVQHGQTIDFTKLSNPDLFDTYNECFEFLKHSNRQLVSYAWYRR